MKAGSLVECIKNIDWTELHERFRAKSGPEKGGLYTVAAMLIDEDGSFIELLEFPPNEKGVQWWLKRFFREVQPSMEVNISELISEPVMA